MRAFAFVVLASLALGCSTSSQLNRPLRAAVGTAASTGFAESTTTSTFQSSVYASATATTRTAQAASVVEGARGDRLWRVSADGSFLEFCQLLDERPYDCEMVPLPVGGAPTLVEPGSLGAGRVLSRDTNGNSWLFEGRRGLQTPQPLPTTPRFGVWVLNSPSLQVYGLFGPIQLGSGLAFCHLDPQGKPRCIDTKTVIARAFSVHVLSQGQPLHVLWGQPLGEGVAVRCEADEVSAAVKCVKAQEKIRP